MLDKTQMIRDEMLTEEQSQTLMKEAILRSGYLLERRVATLLGKSGYKAVTNRGFIDRQNNTPCEYDVYACKKISVYRTGSHEIYPTLVCECKNWTQPIVFFAKERKTFEPLKDEVRVSGIPTKIWQRDKYISVQEFTDVESFHHYCKAEVPIATQCCTIEIKKDRSSWKANYNEELYNIFIKLTKALEYEITEDFKNMAQWFVAEETEDEFTDLSFYYPVVIFPNDIYAAYITEKDDLTFKKCEHVQFNPELFSSHDNEVISYHMDVISEEYLPSYLRMINGEMEAIRKTLQRRRQKVLLSINRIVRECKGLKTKPESWRRYLEFEF